MLFSKKSRFFRNTLYINSKPSTQIMVRRYSSLSKRIKHWCPFPKFSIHIVSLVCTLFTLYLLYQEFDFISSRPTFSSIHHERIDKDLDLRMLICPLPAYNISTLIENGYDDFFLYTIGVSSKWEFIGWSGYRNMNGMKLLDDAVTMKMSDSFPTVKLFYKVGDEYAIVAANYSITRPLFPFGRCVQFSLPTSSEGGFLFLLYLTDQLNNTLSHSGYKIILMDSIGSSVLKYVDQQMTGDSIKALQNRKGYARFSVKISKKKNIENNPNAICYSYSQDFSFDQCLLEQFTSKSTQCLGCVPPWLFKKDERVCNHSFLEIKEKHTCQVTLRDLINGFDRDGCLKPCTTTFYDVKEDFLEPREDVYGVVLKFSADVEVSNTSFLLDPITMMSRLGGIIGVGKEIFWLILLCSGFFKFVKSIIGLCRGN